MKVVVITKYLIKISWLAILVAGLSPKISQAELTKKQAVEFIKELEQTVKSNKKVIADGSLQAKHNHSKKYIDLQKKGEQIPGAFGACSNAALYASDVWKDKMFNESIRNRNKDYFYHLSECKKLVSEMK